MGIPSIAYLQLPQRLVGDKNDFYRSGIKEVSKIRNLITTAQRIFVVPSKGVNLYLLGDKDIYCIELIDDKSLVCRIYYLPKEFRLDIYDGRDSNGGPLIMWKSKKCVYKNIPITLDRVKAESLFLPLLSVL